MMKKRLQLSLATIGLIFAAGCHAPRQPFTGVFGVSVEGRPIECRVFGGGDDVVLIMATIHGDEPAGTTLVQCLADHFVEHPRVLQNRRVVLMPLANPDGLARNTRHNANGIDLNRNFPASNFLSSEKHGAKPLSEPESRTIKAILHCYEPDRIVSIHQPLTCIDYDGPAAELAQAMGTWTDLPIRRLGSLPGSLGSYAGITLGVPIITLELPESAGSTDAETLWRKYGKTLLAAIRYPEPID